MEVPDLPILNETIRNLFFHVAIWFAMFILLIVSVVYSIKYLKNSNFEDDIRASEFATMGIVFGLLGVTTGSVWAKFTWGAFWHWDPRETSIFILLLIYGSLFALRSAIENEDKRAKLSAVYSIIAFLTVPFFIFIMPRIMTGLHPGSANDDNLGPVVDFKMNGTMQVVFYMSLTAFTMFYIWMWRIGYKSIIIKDRITKKII